MKYFPAILLTAVLLAVFGGCKDAPVDPVTGTPIIGDKDTSNHVVVAQDSCPDCIHATKRQPIPYFCIFYRTGPADSDRVELKVRPLIHQYHIDLYQNGYPKSMAISLVLDVPGNALPIYKDMHSIDLTIQDLVPYPPRPMIELRGEPMYGKSGMAFLYEYGNDRSLTRFSTADSVQGPISAHSDIWFKVDTIDPVHRTMSGWLYNGRFIDRNSMPKYLEPAPIYFVLPY